MEIADRIDAACRIVRRMEGVFQRLGTRGRWRSFDRVRSDLIRPIDVSATLPVRTMNHQQRREQPGSSMLKDSPYISHVL